MGAISQDSVKDCDQFAGRGDEGEAHDGEQTASVVYRPCLRTSLFPLGDRDASPRRGEHHPGVLYVMRIHVSPPHRTPRSEAAVIIFRGFSRLDIDPACSPVADLDVACRLNLPRFFGDTH